MAHPVHPMQRSGSKTNSGEHRAHFTYDLHVADSDTRVPKVPNGADLRSRAWLTSIGTTLVRHYFTLRLIKRLELSPLQ